MSKETIKDILMGVFLSAAIYLLIVMLLVF